MDEGSLNLSTLLECLSCTLDLLKQSNDKTNNVKSRIMDIVSKESTIIKRAKSLQNLTFMITQLLALVVGIGMYGNEVGKREIAENIQQTRVVIEMISKNNVGVVKQCLKELRAINDFFIENKY